MKNIILIKYGGSLITDKDKPFTANSAIINQIAVEFKELKFSFPEINFILGHGSGSFGHNVAKKYQTRSGIKDPGDWKGFVEVWSAARKLNTIFINTFLKNEVQCMSFSPSGFLRSNKGKVITSYLESMKTALSAGITPVVYGDVVFDETLGGTILSTEEIFFYLTGQMDVQQILLSGIEPAIYSDFPLKQMPISKITIPTFSSLQNKIGHSASPDVTGGMIEKVRIMIDLIKIRPHLKIFVFSARTPGNVRKILENEPVGTRIEWE